MTILALLAGVAIFLVAEGLPAVTASASELPGGKSLLDYVAPLAFGTVLAAAFAAVLAVPLAVAVALFITHIAPPRIALTLGYLVDLLAAIPSIVYGLWGIFVLGPAAVPVMKWLEENLGFIPFFEGSRLGHRAGDVRRRPGPGGDDPADRLRGRPRGLLADAAQAPGRAPRRSARRAGR